jgi:hypothetical protein
MAFRIETAARGKFTVFILSGRIEEPAIAELKRLFESQADYRHIVLDLKDVGVIDPDVLRFFVRCEADGVKLENCASYIREWMEREKIEGVAVRRLSFSHVEILKRGTYK